MGAFQNIYDPTERGGIKMTKLVVLEVGNRREIMDAIGTDGCIYQMPTIRERLLEEKRNFLEERYLKYFDVIGNFEDSLEGKFEKKMKENPFRDSFCESLEITVPFMNDKEKEFINEYIDMIIPAGKQNAAKK